MKLSVLIPTHNRPKLFTRCLTSVLDTLDGLEFEVIVNNDSNDITEINTKCNIKNYLGESLYNELISFKREQTYENQNFTSDVVDESRSTIPA